MKRFAIALFTVVMGVGVMVQDAEAKRMGGGKPPASAAIPR
jgi:hypothetical protein